MTRVRICRIQESPVHAREKCARAKIFSVSLTLLSSFACARRANPWLLLPDSLLAPPAVVLHVNALHSLKKKAATSPASASSPPTRLNPFFALAACVFACAGPRFSATFLGLVLVRHLRWSVLPRRHRHHNVFPLFTVGFRHAQNQFVFMNPELRRFSDRQQHRVLVILRTYPVDHAIALQHIFLAKHFLGLLALRVRSQNFTRQGLRSLFL